MARLTSIEQNVTLPSSLDTVGGGMFFVDEW